MKLEELMVDTKSAWVEYPGSSGFEVQVNNLSRKELLNLRKRCTVNKFDRKTRTMEEELDDDKFVHEFTDATIKSWKGFKLKFLEDLILVDLKTEDPESFLDFTLENAELLVTNSTEFDNWLNEVVFDLANFRSGAKKRAVGKAGEVAA